MSDIEEFPPVPTQLLWMFDGLDRKAATKMIHDYAASAITWRPSKALREAWERAQQADDKATRLADEIERLQKRIADLEQRGEPVAWILAMPGGTAFSVHLQQRQGYQSDYRNGWKDVPLYLAAGAKRNELERSVRRERSE